jgi:hypothetical protein
MRKYNLTSIRFCRGGAMRFSREAMGYMWQHNRITILIIVTLFAMGVVFRFIPVKIDGDNLLATFHNNLLSPIVALATLGIAFLVFISENHQHWESSL